MREKIHSINEKGGGTPDTDQETIQMVKEKTAEVLAGVSELHGWEHTALVAHYAKLLALGENEDPFNAEMSGWTHDWGRALEKTDEKKRSHAELSGLASKEFYRSLYEEGRLDALQYSDIQRSVKRHSSPEETDRITLKLTRDADKLSRFDPLGFYQNLQGILKEEKLPFYVTGQPIIRPSDAPIMERKDKKCVIDGLNFCLDWEKMAETEVAKKLFGKLDTTYKSFLNLFSRHSDLTDGEFWVAFTKKYADEFRKATEEFKNNSAWTETQNEFDKWVEFYEKTVGPEFYSEEKFQEFLTNYKNKNKNI